MDEIVLPLTEEPVTFTYWKAWSHNYLSSFSEVEAVKKLEEITGVHIEYTCVPSLSATEKFGLMLASGQYTDMFEESQIGTGTYSYPGGHDKAVADGMYVDLTDYVAAYMPNYREYQVVSDQVRRDSTTDEGRLVGAYMLRCVIDPQKKEITIEREPSWAGMAIRRDWLEQLDMEVPETIDELYTVLVAFRDEIGCPAPLSIDQYGMVGSSYLLSSYGAMSEWYRDGDEIKYGPVSDAYKQYVELMAGWYAEGLIDKDFMNPDQDMTGFATDRYGCGNIGWLMAADYYYSEAGSTTNPDFWLEPITPPTVNKGEVAPSMYPSYEVVQPTVITTECENIELACKWLDYHYTWDGMLLNSYGVEGISYHIDESNPNYYVYNDVMAKPEGMTITDARMMHILYNDPGLFDWRASFPYQNQDRVAAYDVWGQQTDEIMVPQGATLTSEEGNEYNNLYVDIKSYKDEMTVKFISGQEPLTKWDEYIKTLEGMNLARCTEIMQQSYDRYMSK